MNTQKTIYNFGAGPSHLPEFVLQEAAKAILDYQDTGLSVLEISHRSAEFNDLLQDTKSLFTELLGIPDNYSILFLGGGASTQFAMLAMNFLANKAGYLDTGVWSQKAIKEAEVFSQVETIASSKDYNYSYIPKNFDIPSDLDYFHITTNNTIYGTQIKCDFDTTAPVFADMSSDILSVPRDVSKYDLIYGGAQKNIGTAGVSFVIIKNELLEKANDKIPTIFKYISHVKKDSTYNTPPVVNIMICQKNLQWLKSQGGVKSIYQRNLEKSTLLYNTIDSSKLFENNINTEDRSIVNVTFTLKKEFANLESDFIQFAKQNNITGIKGHRLTGGFRASLYNAIDINSVKTLCQVIKKFEIDRLK